MKVFITDIESFFAKYLSNALIQRGHEVTGPGPTLKEDTAKLVRLALRADVMILIAMEDEISPLVSSILAALEFGSYPNRKHLILLSSLMTWAGTLEARKNSDRLNSSGRTTDFEQEANLLLGEEDWEGRIPHAAFLELRRVENQVIALASETLSTCVVASGVMYGDGEDLLYSLFRDAWLKNPVEVPSLPPAVPEQLEDGFIDPDLDAPSGDNRGGSNQLPLIHIADMCELMVALVNYTRDNGRLPRDYVVGAESSSISLKELCTTVSAHLGTGTLTYLNERAYTENITQGNTDFLMLQLNVPLYLANGYLNVLVEQEVIKSAAPGGILRCMPQVVKQFKEARGLKPIRVAVLGYPWAGKTKYAKELGERLGLEVVDPVACVLDVAQQIPPTPAEKKRSNTSSNSSLADLSVTDNEVGKIAHEIQIALKGKKLKIENLEEMSVENLLTILPITTLDWCIQRQLKRPELQNRGFVLDAAPVNVNQVQTLLTISASGGKASRRVSRSVASVSRTSERAQSRQKKGKQKGLAKDGSRSRAGTDMTDMSEIHPPAKDLKLDPDLILTHAVQLQGTQEILLERAMTLAKESGLDEKKLAKEQEKFVQILRNYKDREQLPSAEFEAEGKDLAADQDSKGGSQALPYTIIYLKEAMPELVTRCLDIEDEDAVVPAMVDLIQCEANSGQAYLIQPTLQQVPPPGNQEEGNQAPSKRASSATSHRSTSRRSNRNLSMMTRERSSKSTLLGEEDGFAEPSQQPMLARVDSTGDKSAASVGTAQMDQVIQHMRPEEYRDLEARSARFSAYLLNNVSAAVTRGFLKIYEQQPEDPCDFLADYLLEQGVVAEKQAEAAAYLRFESVLAQLRLKEDFEEEELMKRSTGVDSNMSRRSHNRGIPKY